MLKKLFNFVLDFIWPEFCLGCRREGSLCCKKCLQNLEILPLQKQNWPDLPQPYFDGCYVSVDYNNPLIQKLIKCYKYDFIEKISNILVTILANPARNLNLPPDTIIAHVPLHHRRRCERGFDQTQILAKNLAPELGLNYQPLLKRVKKTKSQAKLAKAERQSNLSGAFFAISKNLLDRPVLLIDDVATTGTTLNEASKALRQSGYQKIICLVIAKNNP